MFDWLFFSVFYLKNIEVLCYCGLFLKFICNIIVLVFSSDNQIISHFYLLGILLWDC